jgi:hypothetical protein
MPLYNIDGDLVDYVPHANDFENWKSMLTSSEIIAIQDELNHLVDQKISQGVLTSSWVPSELAPDSHDWSGTPFQVIWDKACSGSWEQTGWCFGLFLWQCMRERNEEWCFIKSGDDDIQGTTYFLRTA